MNERMTRWHQKILDRDPVLKLPPWSVYPAAIVPTAYQRLAAENGYTPVRYVVTGCSDKALNEAITGLLSNEVIPHVSYFLDSDANDWPYGAILWGK